MLTETKHIHLSVAMRKFVYLDVLQATTDSMVCYVDVLQATTDSMVRYLDVLQATTDSMVCYVDALVIYMYHTYHSKQD